MEAYTISERKYRRKLQSESFFPVIILYSSIMSPRILGFADDSLTDVHQPQPAVFYYHHDAYWLRYWTNHGPLFRLLQQRLPTIPPCT